MATEKREFAKKLSSRKAADVRRQVSTAYLQDSNRIKQENERPKNNSNVQYPVVMPWNYENFLDENQDNIDESFASVLKIPDDDWEIVLESSSSRTIEDPCYNETINDRVDELLKFYSGEFKIFRRNYEYFSRQFADPESISKTIKEFEVAEQEEFEEEISISARSSLISLDDSSLDLMESDGLLDEVFQQNSLDDIDERNRQERMRNRKWCVFTLYDSISDDHPSEIKTIPPKFKNLQDINRILLRVSSMEMDNDVEPIFGSVALYDARKRKKITENFYFDLNDSDVFPFLRYNQRIDLSTMVTSCIFNLITGIEDIFIVLKVEKIFYSTETAETLHSYRKEKNKAKITDLIRNIYERLGKYRQLVGWTAVSMSTVINSCQKKTIQTSFDSNIPLENRRASSTQYDSLSRKKPSMSTRHASLERFESRRLESSSSLHSYESSSTEKTSDLLSSFTPSTVKLSSFYKVEADKFHEDELYKYLNELLTTKTITSKKLKPIKASVQFDIQPCPKVKPFSLTPDLLHVKPFPNEPIEPYKVSRELADFSREDVMQPFTSYSNLLFVNPKSLNFSNRGRNYQNLTIKVQLFSGSCDEPLPNIFGKSNTSKFQREAYTAVTYHNRTPEYNDEIKIKLPADLTHLHFLLFTAFHVSCRRKEDGQQMETPVGYTWLPLLRDGQLKSGDFFLPMTTEKPSANLCICFPNESSLTNIPNVKWIDNRKEIFIVSINALTSVYAKDNYIDRFFDIYSKAENGLLPRLYNGDISTFERHLKETLYSVTNANLKKLIHFLPIVLNKLISLFLHPPVINGQLLSISLCCLETIARIVLKVEKDLSSKEDNLLKSYVYYKASISGKSNSKEEKTSNSPQGYYQTKIKSMAEDIFHHSKMSGKSLLRFSSTYIDDLKSLVEEIIAEIFVQDHQCEKITDESSKDTSCFIDLRNEFLKIICLHEHYFALNLPFGSWYMSSPPSSPCGSICSSSSISTRSSTSTLIEKGNFFEMPEEFRQQHFLVGLVLSHFSLILQEYPSKIKLGIELLKILLASHDSNVRLNQTNIRSRVATLYMPILTMILNHSSRLYRRKDEELSEEVLEKFISQSSLYGKQSSSHTSPSNTMNKFNKAETRDLLLCLIFILKAVDKHIIQAWICEYISTSKVGEFIEVLKICLSIFEYEGQFSPDESKSSKTVLNQLEDAIIGSGNARDMMLRRKHSNISIHSDSLSYFKDDVRWRKDKNFWNAGAFKRRSNHLEGHLATEITLVILDVLDIFIECCESQQNIPVSALKCILHCLSINQSTTSLKCVFELQRSLVCKYPELIFEDGEHCGELCLRLLQHCCSSRNVVRTQASASIYVLMRQNFDICNNFSRVKVQITMSLSSLVGGQTGKFNEGALRKSLKTILKYADRDEDMQFTSFIDQIKDLVFVLHSIITNTVKLKEVKNDPEMLDDLMHRIAFSYQTSPHLRLTWLLSLAVKHAEREEFAEEGECYLHASGLVIEYLVNVSHLEKDYLPIGCVAFQKLSSNISEESFISDDVLTLDDSATGKDFSETGLINLLKNCADAFRKASLHEAESEICEIMLPLLKSQENYNLLCELHSRLNQIYSKILTDTSLTKRPFGTYFRVGFYGSNFGEIDGDEYIYKERSFTGLAEISQRLENLFGAQFGRGTVEILKDSNQICRENLDPNKMYLQITYVEPFFEDFELLQRKSSFQRNFNIRRFVFSTPFTPTGKAHGEIADQWKRKTILTCENSFPYTKKRIKVVLKQEMNLTPIEVAIEDVQNKVNQLTEACAASKIDVKYLQMVLQGCIGATVNKGPMQIAKTFLEPLAQGLIVPTKQHNKLRVAFKNFVRKSQEALKQNEKLIMADQEDYQTELKKNFEDISHKLTFLISPHQNTIKRKRAHRLRDMHKRNILKENINSVSHV
ncbi:DgyrCDS1134 [Dimorphilus gyrociliatus]|uniref:DgyrCDS1134 n=1 Tax=Dimorphilus gyrociliatus TaxID=2664684 RepID=A0A7I8VBG1_9ANNE|nr:DgyrCDS1134 [Dimorphilus gyrociliatus]